MNSVHKYSKYSTLENLKKSQLSFNLGFTLYDIYYTTNNSVLNKKQDFKHCIY